jgi:hypothetical protein
MKKKVTAVLAVAALAVVVPLVSTAWEREAGEDAAPSGWSGPAAPERADESATPVAASGPTGSTLVLPDGPRIIQTASLRLSVRAGGFEGAVERARTVVAGLGGFVVSSSATQRRAAASRRARSSYACRRGATATRSAR